MKSETLKFITKSFVLLSLLAVGSSALAEKYVFVYNGNYLRNNSGTIANSTNFVPNTCIWTCYNGTDEATLPTGNSNLRALKNGDYYLNSSDTRGQNVSTSTTAQNYWRLDNSNNNNFLAYRSGNTCYLYYRSSTWKTSRSGNSDEDSRYSSSSTDYRATAYTVTTGYLTGGYTDITISGDEYITTTGTKTYIHTNTINQTACSTYTFNNTTYYSTDNGNTASTTNPGSAVTTGYTWSLSGANGHATVNNNGQITVTSIPDEDVVMTLTCTHATSGKSATKTVTLTNVAPVDAGYVIYSGGTNGNYLTTSTSGTTSFNPNTCLWQGESGSTLKNGDYYIYLGNSSAISTNTRDVTFEGTESGTTGRKVRRGTTDNYWLRYNNGWTRTGTSTDSGTDVLFAVRKRDIVGADNTTAPTISAALNSTNSGIQFSHTDVSGIYSPDYTDYVFYNNTHHYWYKNASHTTAPSTVNFSTTDATYTWSITSGGNYASIDATTGLLTSKGAATTQQTVTVTLTTTEASSGYSNTKTYTVQILDHTATTVTAGIGDHNIINTVNGTLTLRGFLSGTYTAAYTTYTFNSGSHNLYNGIDYGYDTPTINEASSCTYTWSLSGEGASHSELSSTTGQTPTLTYTSDAGQDVVVNANLTVTHPDFPEFSALAGPYPIILYSATITAPTIDFAEVTNTVTLSVPLEGTTYYTTDGSDPKTSSTRQTYDPSSPIVLTTSPTVVKAYSERWGTLSAMSEETITLKLGTPEISFGDDGTMTITLADAPDGTVFYYTTDGSDPTSTSAQYNSSSKPKVENGTTVKVIAIKEYYHSSDIASDKFVMESGVRDGVVILNDYEDHTWTYYAGAYIGNYKTKTDYQGKLYNPDPRNIKITYLGNGQRKDNTTLNAVTGVKVGVDADANTFVYYKTIENNSGYKYTTIPNPFSVRPKNNSTYYGFSYWRVKSVSGGSITYGSNTIADNTTNSTTQIPADAEITFVPTRTYTTNCQSMEVVFEAVWEPAEVSTNGTFSQGYNSVERNFYVVSSNASSDMPVSSSPCTYSSFYPNGTTNGTTAATSENRATRRGGFTAKADSKIEYIYLNNNNSTINGAGHNLTIGRGVSNSNGTELCATDIYGFQFISNSNASRDAQNFSLRIESGNYTNCHLFSNNVSGSNYNYRPTFQGTNSVRVTLGCDYDRARANDGGNDKLTITSNLWMGEGCWFSDPANLTNGYFKCWTKSGKLLTATLSDGAGGVQSFYIGTSGTQTTQSGSDNRKSGYIPPRFLYVEGGILGGIAGGLDDVYYTDTSLMRVYVKMTGGIVRGCVYGAGSYAIAAGRRNFIFLGGEIGGWIAAGCNGIGGNTTEGNADGTTQGSTFLYIGGNTKVGYKETVVNEVEGGNVFGAGRGASGKDYPVGTVLNSNVVIADNAKIEKNVYGGGNYGYTIGNANLYILGGAVDGNVFGGSNMVNGKTPTIYMDGGLVKSGIYGGSNTQGTISDNVTIQINGGQVGADASHTGNVHGGGYGKETRVTGNVDITFGTRNTSGETAGSAVVYGDVYGGSALGYVNGTTTSTTKHTNVTLNGGDVYGAVYGGGLGDGSNAANVYAPVKVAINGGSATNVFGCNNTNGRPMSTVNVNMTGGLVRECVYGGGNAAGYTGTPHVAISGGEVDKHVFGGGLGANAVVTGDTDVKVTEAEGATTLIKGNVYGGGNAAAVTGNTKVTIGE